MAFNVYKWRRNQLITESEAINENKAESIYNALKDFLKDTYHDKMGKLAVVSAISRGLMEETSLNEVKVSDLKFNVKDQYPANTHLGSSVSFQTEEKFENWRKKFLEKEGNIELKKGPAGWKPSK